MPQQVKVYLAIDLGASSGRVVAGRFDGKRLSLEEVHRFTNGGTYIGDRLYWDVLDLWKEIQNGLRAAGRRYGDHIRSLGVDTWGVDFGLLDKNDELLSNPRHYRDQHTSDIFEKAFAIVPREKIYDRTGLQFMPFNTIFQLLALKNAGSVALANAKSMLLMPDLFHWMMTGEKVNESTNASTTQMLDPSTGQWATDLINEFDLPTDILQPLTLPGTRIGKLRERLGEDLNVASAEVVLPGTHDTASAVAAVPAEAGKNDWCYISSGTWSLMGVEAPAPIINARGGELNFTNEGGIEGRTRFLKNIAGLWLVQECRRIWGAQGRDYDWAEMVKRAEESTPLVSLVNPDDPRFSAPANMPDEIAAFCNETNQSAPIDEGSMIRCILESLALRYRMVVEWLEELTGNRINTIHIVGGGVQNELLCQMAADATGRVVVAGPIEATAIGNVMVQAVSAGDIDSIDDARAIIRESFAAKSYEPSDASGWEEAYATFQNLVKH